MKVAIIGGGCRTAREVTAYGEDVDLWVLNAIRPAWIDPARIGACFNLHRWSHLKRDWHNGIYNEAAFANACPEIPFVVVDPWPKDILPNQVLYPLDELRCLPRGGEYHSSSIDMMVAYAIWLGYEEIAIHGIDFFFEAGEPLSARGCLEYWVGVAEGLGIPVHIAKDCAIFHQYHYVREDTVYGFDDVRMIEMRDQNWSRVSRALGRMKEGILVPK